MYGTTEASTAVPSASSSRCGRPATCQAPRAPNGSSTSAPTASAAARPPRPGTAALSPRARHDVQRPERRGDQRERRPRPGRACARPAAVAALRPSISTPATASQHPAGVAPAPGQRRRERERAEELDGHRGAERQPGERGVEEPVRAREADPVERDRAPLRGRQPRTRGRASRAAPPRPGRAAAAWPPARR